MLAYQLGQYMQLPTTCDDVDCVNLLISKVITKSVGVTIRCKVSPTLNVDQTLRVIPYENN
jgi:hypothetical protein